MKVKSEICRVFGLDVVGDLLQCVVNVIVCLQHSQTLDKKRRLED